MRLSNNFLLSEFTKSNTALRLGIDNTPTEEVIYNLTQLCRYVLQPIKDYYTQIAPIDKIAVIVSSGFRCLQLNRAIGSSDRSQHILGMAADFEIPGLSNLEVATWIRDNLEFDQLILEYYDESDPNSGWIHISFNPNGNNRNDVYRFYSDGRKKRGLR